VVRDILVEPAYSSKAEQAAGFGLFLVFIKGIFLAAVWFAFGTQDCAAYRKTPEGKIAKGKIGIGLNYPGIGVRYFFTDRFSLEARGYYEKNILISGPRLSRYFGLITGVFPYLGLEADYVSFKGEFSKGSGIFTQALLGGEYFIGRKVSVQLDFGPAYIFLKDKKYSVSVGGIEYVTNFGISYYFGAEHNLSASVAVPTQAARDMDKEYRAAVECYKSGDYNGAWRKAYAILREAPQHWRSWAIIGNCQYAKGDRQGAMASYQRALEIHPDNPRLKAWVEKLRVQVQPSGE